MAHYLYVCVTCKKQDAPLEPLGEILFREVHKEVQQTDLRDIIAVKPIRCFNACTKACVIGLGAASKVGYVIGHQSLESIPDILKGAELYSMAENGIIKKPDRPPAFKENVLARMPIFDPEPKTNS